LPWQTALTRIPCGPASSARPRGRPMPPDLLAALAALLSPCLLLTHNYKHFAALGVRGAARFEHELYRRFANVQVDALAQVRRQRAQPSPGGARVPRLEHQVPREIENRLADHRCDRKRDKRTHDPVLLGAAFRRAGPFVFAIGSTATLRGKKVAVEVME